MVPSKTSIAALISSLLSRRSGLKMCNAFSMAVSALEAIKDFGGMVAGRTRGREMTCRLLALMETYRSVRQRCCGERGEPAYHYPSPASMLARTQRHYQTEM